MSAQFAYPERHCCACGRESIFEESLSNTEYTAALNSLEECTSDVSTDLDEDYTQAISSVDAACDSFDDDSFAEFVNDALDQLDEIESYLENAFTLLFEQYNIASSTNKVNFLILSFKFR